MHRPSYALLPYNTRASEGNPNWPVIIIPENPFRRRSIAACASRKARKFEAERAELQRVRTKVRTEENGTKDGAKRKRLSLQ